MSRKVFLIMDQVANGFIDRNGLTKNDDNYIYPNSFPNREKALKFIDDNLDNNDRYGVVTYDIKSYFKNFIDNKY